MNQEHSGITCIVCSIFRRELEAIQEREDMGFSIRYTPSMLHMSPEKLHVQLDSIVHEELGKGNKVLLLFGECHPYMNDHENMSNVTRVRGINCPNIFLGSEKYRSMRKEGIFFLMPEWAIRWREVFTSELGFSSETAQSFMTEMHSRLVYLDTGVIPVPTETLQEISEYTGLSCDIMSVSLDQLFLAIKEAIKKLVGSGVKSHIADSQISSDIQYMSNDIIENLLKSTDNPSRMNKFLAHQLRELTGAKIVILIQCLHNFGDTGHRIVHMNPERHTGRVESSEFQQLFELMHDIASPQMWDPKEGKSEVEERLDKLGFGISIVSPLIAEKVRVGSIVLLDLPDKQYITQIVDVINLLSTIVSLVFRNSLLYEKQESIIETRTEEIRKSREKYRAYIDNAPDGIFVVDSKGKYLEVNNAACQITGFTNAELLSMSISDLVSPESLDAVMDDFAHLLSEGNLNSEALCRHKGGSKIYLSIHAIRVEKDKYLGFCRDITERKNVEVQLHLLNRAIEQSPVTVLITNSKGDIEYVNSNFTKLTGYTYEEAIGQNPRIVQSAKHTLSFYKQLWHTITQGKTWKGEFYNKKKNGERYFEDATISPIKDSQGVITHYVAVKEDITEYKEAENKRTMLEAQVRQLQKLDAIGTLAGGIAHDFNNILTPILGFVDMSLIDLEPDSKIYNNLKHVSKAANRAKELVNQILTFSRRVEKEPKPLMVHVIVKEVLKLLRASLPATIDIQSKIDTECGTVLADATRIHQVIMNLCTNARDAMEDGGGILEASLNRVSVNAELAGKHHNLVEGTYAVLKVKDTGHGMSDKTTRHIFEPFFTTKGIGKGTGLGLSVVHGIVRSYGGEITVKSEPGIGSTFQVYLPIIDVDVEHRLTKQGPIPRGSENILYVDDEEEIASLGKLMLEELGYKVTMMTNSMKALEEFRSNRARYDLVITDLMMPDMTGDKLTKELIRIRPDIPVILTTGFSETFKPEDCKKLGIRDYVMKPFGIRDIAKAIRYALRT